jgi:copper chaperone CopZ
MQKMTLNIGGMVCGGCANSVKQALLGIDGVTSAQVSHADGRADVEYDPAKVDPMAFEAAISAAGYTLVPPRT